MATEGKDYVVGKGRVYFAAFAEGTKIAGPERYLGNTPELSTSSDESTLDHFDADSGLNVKDESVTIEKNITGTLVTDHISPENVAMFFGGAVGEVVIAPATALTETVANVRGRYVQLGVNEANPTGARDITTLVVKVGVVTIAQPNNYEADLDLGRVYIELDSPDIDDTDPVIFTYNIAGSTRTQIIGSGTEVRGALRFISANPVGSQTDYFWPYVKLSANGDFALKSDEWMQIPFSFEVLKLDATTERVYAERRTV
jgi:hypothetical protein